MSLIRQFEERLKWLVETGLPIGAVHYYIGQEAVAAGVCAELGPDDWIASNHRGHGHCIAKGVDVAPMMAELFGKVTGTNRGKGCSMHVTDVTKGILGVNPIVSASVSHALGAALSAKVRKTRQVAVAFFGGAGIGITHECMNSSHRKRRGPLCENNGCQATPADTRSSPRVRRAPRRTTCPASRWTARTLVPCGGPSAVGARAGDPPVEARRIATSNTTGRRYIALSP